MAVATKTCTSVTVDSAGLEPWTFSADGSELSTNDNNPISVTMTDHAAVTDTLLLKAFGFTSADIPASSTINSINAVIRYKSNLGGTVGTISKFDLTLDGSTTTEAGGSGFSTITTSYTDQTNNFTTVPSYAQIVGNTNLGLFLQVTSATNNTRTTSIDSVTINVDFTAPAGGDTSYLRRRRASFFNLLDDD